ncbi:nicotinate-nucleotide adenylyltransferase [Stagnimonas aquatica]|uniref:Probable nicotinate-nucleotide adenylyltransferase n=1 Tax=Stagnimonas aquatica TaxID=2689987 RepID=A0A3N0VKM0_9GAMM|nr:nicotinate-nucleotide adenylyltransferase [Stagnimonas aquatica]ROH93251.1 nicotinate-nucleotide adenylyltransferase [Stagnimonas aquatica]
MAIAPIGIFGGAFAPFHNGHLRLALEAMDRLQLSQVRLIPTAHPAHRPDSRVSPQKRLEWVRRAVAKEKGLIADDREIKREGPSYTIDTLAELKKWRPRTPLVLLLGADAFAHFHTWHRWREILDLAHLAVVSRPGSALLPPVEADILAERHADSVEALRAVPAGLWLELPLPLLEISSSRIRRLLRTGHSVRGLVPDAILDALTPQDLQALTDQDDQSKH